MLENDCALHDLVADLAIYPQCIINVATGNVAGGGANLMREARITQAVRDAESALDGNGRVVLRPSGTEPVVRVMIEGEDKTQVKKLAKQLAKEVAAAAKK